MYNQAYPGMMPYTQMPYNPMMNAQQRLAQMEQQYPQFAQQQQTPMQQPMAQQPAFVKCRAVTSFDEAKAAMIDLDGSLHVFTDIGNGKIYTKQINLDGTATLNVYSRVDGNTPIPTPTPVVDNSPKESFVSQSLFEQTVNSLKQELTSLKMKFEQGDEVDVQPNANAARDRRRVAKSNGTNVATDD